MSSRGKGGGHQAFGAPNGVALDRQLLPSVAAPFCGTLFDINPVILYPEKKLGAFP
jgi:hypothetical protein